jgi:hypothetical protein
MKALLVGIAVLTFGVAPVFAQEGLHSGRKGEAGGYSQCGIKPCDPAGLAVDRQVKAQLSMGPHVLHHRYSCKHGSGRRCTVRAPGN